MADPKRTVKQIHEEYTALCAKAGHLQYHVFTNKKDLDLLNQQLRDLNFEAAKVQAEEADAAKAESEKSNGQA